MLIINEKNYSHYSRICLKVYNGYTFIVAAINTGYQDFSTYIYICACTYICISCFENLFVHKAQI